MENPSKYQLNAPIPGMSLTTEPGNRPWEQAPQLVEVADVVNHYSDMLSSPDIIGSAMDAAAAGVPLEAMAKTMVMNGAMTGTHTVDTGFLVVPVVVEMMKAVAEINDIGYSITAEDKKGTPVSKKVAQEAINEVVQAAKGMPDEMPVDEKPTAGLMSKGK